jgi:hypothetical protein
MWGAGRVMGGPRGDQPRKNQAGQGRRRPLRKNADSTIGARGPQSTGPLVLSRRNPREFSFRYRFRASEGRRGAVPSGSTS